MLNGTGCETTIAFRSTVPAFALITAGLMATACSTVETQSFNVARSSNVGSAVVAVDADFSKYDRLQAVDMGIFFPAGVSMQSTDLQRLRQAFREAFVAELDGYRVTREPGPSTIAVQASLIDLRGAGTADVSSLRRDIRDLAKPGSLVFLMELKDSQTNRILARAADRATAPPLATGGNTDWEAVDEAAAHWANLFREFLDRNLGGRQ